MSLRDLKDNVAVDMNFYHKFTASNTHTGAVLDTAHYDSGIMFCFAAPVWVDGTYTPNLRESDTGTGDWSTIPAEQLIGTIADATLSAATAEGDAMPTIGLLSTKRFVELEVEGTAVSSGATVVVTVNKMPELKPVE